jgi:hypothetical protein
MTSLLTTASWVIRKRDTGEVIMETFNKQIIEKLNAEKYEAIPILEYLQSLNSKTKQEQQP